MKTLILKTTRNGNLDTDDFQRGLLEWRNTPRSDGISPAQALYGRQLSSFLFAHSTKFAPEWRTKSAALEDTTAPLQHDHYNQSARSLRELDVGSQVDIQHPRTKLWCESGVVVEIGRHRDYTIKLPSGRILRRNRRFLRDRVLPSISPTSSPRLPDAQPQPSTVSAPRRSKRRHQPTKRFTISSFNGQSYD